MPSLVTGVAGYRVYQENEDGSLTLLNATLLPELGLIDDSGLLQNTSYVGKYFASAVDFAGHESDLVELTDPDAVTLSATPDQLPMPANMEADIDAIMARVIAKGVTPSMTIGVTSPFGYLIKTYGGTGAGAEKYYRMASMTKMLTARRIYQLIGLGLFGLDDTLDVLGLTGYTNGSTITVRMLLNHTSGLFDYTQVLGQSYTISPAGQITQEQVVGLIKGGAPMFPPSADGSLGYYYNNSNYYTLGNIIEKFDPEQRIAADIIDTEILAGAGMTNTYFQRETGPPKAPAADAFDYDPVLAVIAGIANSIILTLTFGLAAMFGLLLPTQVKRSVANQDPDMTWTAGAGIALVADMLKWGKELYEGNLITPELHELIFSDEYFPPPHPMTPWGLDAQGPIEYRYAGAIYKFAEWFGHGGTMLGGDSGTMYHRPTGTVITAYQAFQTAACPSLTYAWYEIADYLYPGSITSTPTRAVPSGRQVSFLGGEPDVSVIEVGTYRPAPALLGFGGGIPNVSIPVAPTGAGLTFAGGVPDIPVFTPSEVENTNKTSEPVPVGAVGCWVTLIGGGGRGYTGGPLNSGGGGGGGGGGRVDRVFIPVSALGSTYSVTQGLGSIYAGGTAGNSVFSSGSVTLTAGGAIGANGGTCSASGASPTMHNGSTYTSPNNASNAGAAGGIGGYAGAFSSGPGSPGGNSTTRTGGATGLPGVDATDAADGDGGAGGGGGYSLANSYPSIGYAGGKGGKYGGGGGGGGSGWDIGGAGGIGGDGYSLVEWV